MGTPLAAITESGLFEYDAHLFVDFHEVLWILSGCTVKTELKYFLNALFKNILFEPIVFPIVILLVMTWENSVHVHWSK